MNIFDAFRKKVEEILPVDKKWVGCADGYWDNSKHVAYNLYVTTDGVRIVEMTGDNAEKHPVYLTAVYPWTQGAPDNILFPYLKTKDDSYFKTSKVAPAPKARKK